MIVWLNGTHGVGETTTARLVRQRVPDEVGEVLMDVSPSLREAGDFQHWDPWRPLVVQPAWRLLDYLGGTLVIPMMVLVEACWRELSARLAARGVALRHVVLHADVAVLRSRLEGGQPVPSPFRLSRLAPDAEAARTSPHRDADLVVDASGLTRDEVADQVISGPALPAA